MNSKLLIDQNCKPKTIEYFRKKIGENFCDPGLDKDFLNMIPKTTSIEELDKFIFNHIYHCLFFKGYCYRYCQ